MYSLLRAYFANFKPHFLGIYCTCNLQVSTVQQTCTGDSDAIQAFFELFSIFQCKLGKSAQNHWPKSIKSRLSSFYCKISLSNNLSSVYWILRDSEKQLAFKMMVFSRGKLTFSTKPRTFLLNWGRQEYFFIRVFLTLR